MKCAEKKNVVVKMKEFKQVSVWKLVNQDAVKLTESVDERCVKFSGEKRVRHVTQKLLQQSSNIMNAVLFI